MDSYQYDKKQKAPSASRMKEISDSVSGGVSNSTLEEIMKGRTAPSAAMLGHRESLAPALQAKMQGAYSADFSNVEIYRSKAAGAAGFNGIASGNKVALAPDVDLNSHEGQAVLGHELSHVVAQAQGIGGGRGFLGNAGLERQADVQGERAASGMRAIAGSGLSMETSLDFSSPTMSAGGMESAALTPISASTGAFGMGAPMQGEKNKGDGEAQTASRDIQTPFMEKTDPDKLGEVVNSFGLNSESEMSPFAKDNVFGRHQVSSLAKVMELTAGDLNGKKLPNGLSIPEYLSKTDPAEARKNNQFKMYQKATYVEGANWGGKLSKEELAATLLYTGAQYKQFHNAASGLVVDGKYAQEGMDAATGYRNAMGAVNSGLNKFENHYTRRLYKGMNPVGLRGLMSEGQQEEFDNYQLSPEEGKNPAKALAAKIRHVMNGAVVASHLLCSTSYDEAVATDFAGRGKAAFGGAGLLLDIEHPPGAPGAPLGPITVNPEENEFLLPAGIKMQVMNIEENGNIVTLHVRSLPKTDEGVERKEQQGE